ncbi:hypothetical protein G4W71_08610 [Clostridium botulinum]|uniref:hypothetical protein n=1 Tax=Clostridium botulinum TaxID=1491 RepID=UPI0007E14B78|nr:hypothetical protein [Clostridium botulinum]KEI83962.1 hypothetical protein N493_18785 [Clostridium botulinum B2 433]MBE1304085.1 hypothetical protein [Clostridium botulinum]
MELKIGLNDKDLETLNQVKSRKDILFKDLIYEYDGECYKLGEITVSPESIVGSNYEVIDRFYQIIFSLGSHIEEPLIRTTASLKYIVVKENIDKTLFGEHLLVNTIDGKRIKFIN